MSPEPSPADLRASSTLLNTLHAEHQGAFVHEVVLAKLGSSAHDESRVVQLQSRLGFIGEWGARLWRREPLLQADGGSTRPQELARALGWLDDIAGSLETVGRGLEDALDAVEAHEHDGKPVPEAALVAAAQGWAAYAWENELRGVVQFGEVLDEPELAERAREQLAQAASSLQLAHHLLQRLEGESPPGCALLGELHRACGHLPEAFAVKCAAVRELAAEIRRLESGEPAD